jgi:hypothetical protein
LRIRLFIRKPRKEEGRKGAGIIRRFRRLRRGTRREVEQPSNEETKDGWKLELNRSELRERRIGPQIARMAQMRKAIAKQEDEGMSAALYRAQLRIMNGSGLVSGVVCD